MVFSQLTRWAEAHRWSARIRRVFAELGVESLEDIAELYVPGEPLPKVQGFEAAFLAVQTFCRAGERSRLRQFLLRVEAARRRDDDRRRTAVALTGRVRGRGGSLRSTACLLRCGKKEKGEREPRGEQKGERWNPGGRSRRLGGLIPKP